MKTFRVTTTFTIEAENMEEAQREALRSAGLVESYKVDEIKAKVFVMDSFERHATDSEYHTLEEFSRRLKNPLKQELIRAFIEADTKVVDVLKVHIGLEESKRIMQRAWELYYTTGKKEAA